MCHVNCLNEYYFNYKEKKMCLKKFELQYFFKLL